MRKISRSLKLIGARSALRSVSAKAMMRCGSFSDSVLRLEQAAEPARQREQDRVADRHADRIVDLLEAVEVDHHHGRADAGVGLGEGEHRLEAVDEKLAIGEAREIVVHRVVQQPLLRGLEVGHVGERADEAHHLAVGPDHRPRLEREPEVMAVRRAQAEILHQAAAPLLQHAVERGAEAVAVERVQHLEPVRRGTFERAALESERVLGLGTGEDLVGGDVPVPDHVARAGERQCAAFDVRHDAVRDAAREGVLHHREADQHDDEDEAAEEGRRHDVVRHRARHGQPGANDPDHQQEPGRDQQHRAVVAVGREKDDEREAGNGDEQERKARDARCDRRIEQRDGNKRAEKHQPADGDVGVAHVPAVEIEVGEQEDEQGGGQDRLARGAPHALGARRHVEHLAPESEVDADIDEHRPAQRGGGGKHHAALHDEQDGQEEREQARDADDDAVVEREAVDLVLVGVGLPQIDLRQLVGAQLGHEGDDGAGIERNAEDVGGGAVLPVGTVAGARRDGDHAREAEVGPQQAGARHLIVRHHDQPVDLLVARIGEREHRPVGAGLAPSHLDTADDSVGARRGRYLDAIAVGRLALDRIAEVDRGRVDAHVHRVDSVSGRSDQRREHDRRCEGGPQATQEMTSVPLLARQASDRPRRDCASRGNLFTFVPISRRATQKPARDHSARPPLLSTEAGG